LSQEPKVDLITGSDLDWNRNTEATEFIFIDNSLDNYNQLASSIQSDLADSGRSGRIAIINSSESALTQISLALSGLSELTAIHIFSHGLAGAIQLGNELVGQQQLLANQTLLSSWANALTADGDILLYGCAVAQGAQGEAFLQQLAQLTGADVAASSDATGSLALGGNWQLEQQVGSIETTVLTSQDQGLLLGVESPWQSISTVLADASSALAGDGYLGIGKLGILEALRGALAAATETDGTAVADQLNGILNSEVGTAGVNYVSWTDNTLTLDLDRTLSDSLDLSLGEGSPIQRGGLGECLDRPEGQCQLHTQC